MRDEDEIIEAYDEELGPEPGAWADVAPEPRRPSSRGFWIVLGAILATGAIVVVAIFANRPIADMIGRAQHDLRAGQAAAVAQMAETGTYEGADAEALGAAELDGGALRVVGPDEASSGLGVISVYADATTWAAAVSARPNGCFYLKLVQGRSDPLYGVGTLCTGREALDATDPRW